VTEACEIDEAISLSITSEIDWEDCDGSVEWFWTKFCIAAQGDEILVPKFFWKDGATWDFQLRKDNNSLRARITEKREGAKPRSPDAAGVPAVLLYGPHATIQVRRQTLDQF
jgi:hypothetical protein